MTCGGSQVQVPSELLSLHPRVFVVDSSAFLCLFIPVCGGLCTMVHVVVRGQFCIGILCV